MMSSPTSKTFKNSDSLPENEAKSSRSSSIDQSLLAKVIEQLSSLEECLSDGGRLSPGRLSPEPKSKIGRSSLNQTKPDTKSDIKSAMTKDPNLKSKILKLIRSKPDLPVESKLNTYLKSESPSTANQQPVVPFRSNLSPYLRSLTKQPTPSTYIKSRFPLSARLAAGLQPELTSYGLQPKTFYDHIHYVASFLKNAEKDQAELLDDIYDLLFASYDNGTQVPECVFSYLVESKIRQYNHHRAVHRLFKRLFKICMKLESKVSDKLISESSEKHKETNGEITTFKAIKEPKRLGDEFEEVTSKLADLTNKETVMIKKNSKLQERANELSKQINDQKEGANVDALKKELDDVQNKISNGDSCLSHNEALKKHYYTHLNDLIVKALDFKTGKLKQ